MPPSGSVGRSQVQHHCHPAASDHCALLEGGWAVVLPFEVTRGVGRCHAAALSREPQPHLWAASMPGQGQGVRDRSQHDAAEVAERTAASAKTMLWRRAADRRRAGASWAVRWAASAHCLLKFRCLLKLQLRCTVPTRTAGKAAAHTARCLHPPTFSWKCSSVSRAGGGSLLRVVMVYRTPSWASGQGEHGRAGVKRARPARKAKPAPERDAAVH